MKGSYIIGILTLAIIMQSLVLALIPPPPANQMIGVYDTTFINLDENKCRNCHISGVPDNHHMLVQSGEYLCLNCHPVITNPDGSQSITMLRDCMQCHGSTFNSMNIPRPHHETQDAQDKHCSNCHGNIVDDYDDGHYIPAYNVSLVTPDTKYKVINATNGKKWGGCEACHEQNTTMDPPIQFNNNTHHNLGSLSGFNPPNSSKCATCHDSHHSSYGPDFIRYCERCHATKSLHNIQYDYVNTSTQPGYGHIGNDWDCKGCHAWYVAGGIAPGTDVIVPVITLLSTNKVLEGETTVLTIQGSNFVGINQSSVIVLSDGINLITLAPSSITASEIVVTVSASNKGDYGIYALKKGSAKSNRLPMIVVPKVMIYSAEMNDSKITIKGSGFGQQYDPLFTYYINVTIEKISKKGTVTH
ncbi:MAG: hypothetical protein E4G94_04545 [ANME-2 cluster archaeon]|nr:MAG: hypothetical protein E4G94_04545 [ANME-2 cluster archaeon]